MFRALLDKIKSGLARTRDVFAGIASLFRLRGKVDKDFLSELKSDPEVTARLKPAEIEECFDLAYHSKHVDTIFKRVFGSAPKKKTKKAGKAKRK